MAKAKRGRSIAPEHIPAPGDNGSPVVNDAAIEIRTDLLQFEALDRALGQFIDYAEIQVEFEATPGGLPHYPANPVRNGLYDAAMSIQRESLKTIKSKNIFEIGYHILTQSSLLSIRLIMSDIFTGWKMTGRRIGIRSPDSDRERSIIEATEFLPLQRFAPGPLPIERGHVRGLSVARTLLRAARARLENDKGHDDPIPSEPTPVAEFRSIQLYGPHERVILFRSKSKGPLSGGRYKAVRALVLACSKKEKGGDKEPRASMNDLFNHGGRGEHQKRLKELIEGYGKTPADPDWRAAIIMARGPHRGYGINF